MPYKDPEKAKANARERSRRWAKRHPKRAKDSRQRHYAANREKQCAKSRAWYHENRERVLLRLRRYHLMKRYGLTEEQYAALGTTCAICRRTEDGRQGFRLAVDHDHGTGKVRGLLCSNCNCGIGYFKHDEALLVKAVEYLRRTT